MTDPFQIARNRARMAKVVLKREKELPPEQPVRLRWAPVQPPDVAVRPTLEQIIQAVCRGEQVTRMDLMSRRRTRSLITPRHMVAWLARRLTPRTFPEIARKMDNRNHTTIISSVSWIERARQQDQELQRRLDHYILILSPDGATAEQACRFT